MPRKLVASPDVVARYALDRLWHFARPLTTENIVHDLLLEYSFIGWREEHGLTDEYYVENTLNHNPQMFRRSASGRAWIPAVPVRVVPASRTTQAGTEGWPHIGRPAVQYGLDIVRNEITRLQHLAATLDNAWAVAPLHDPDIVEIANADARAAGLRVRAKI